MRLVEASKAAPQRAQTPLNATTSGDQMCTPSSIAHGGTAGSASPFQVHGPVGDGAWNEGTWPYHWFVVNIQYWPEPLSQTIEASGRSMVGSTMRAGWAASAGSKPESGTIGACVVGGSVTGTVVGGGVVVVVVVTVGA